MNLDQKLALAGGRPSGFDYLRLALATAVICVHSVAASAGASVAVLWLGRPWLAPLLALLLPMFFALSGFLVAGSLQRCRSMVSFMGLRVIRIVPALVMEVVLSALLLGPLLTTLPLAAYFSDRAFLQYFWNLLGIIQFGLPGVFHNNPLPYTVNGQLWTVPWELKCYVTLLALALLGLRQRPWLAPLGALAVTVAGVLTKVVIGHDPHYGLPGTLVPGWALVAGFLCGVSLFLYRNRLPHDGRLALAMLALALALFSVRYGAFATCVPVAYLTVYVGLCNPRRLTVLRGADYSYGMFLYGFVIQQTFAALGDWTHVWWLNALVSVTCAVLVAALSWHWVEQPALALKGPLQQLERWWLSGFAQQFGTRPLR